MGHSLNFEYVTESSKEKDRKTSTNDVGKLVFKHGILADVKNANSLNQSRPVHILCPVGLRLYCLPLQSKMENISSGMQVCPFCGKAFKRLKTHLPHCKMARIVNSKYNSKETEINIAIPQQKLNCKCSPASSNKKMKVKANSAKILTQKEEASSTKKNNHSIGLGNELCASVQSIQHKDINEPLSGQEDLMNKGRQIKKKSQQSVSKTTKGQPKRAKKEMVIKTKSSEHFLKRDDDKVDMKLNGTATTKVKSSQKIVKDNCIKKKQENNEHSSLTHPLNEKGCTDLVSQSTFCPKGKSILNLEQIYIQPEFEKETAVLDLKAYEIVPRLSCAIKSNSLHFTRQENAVSQDDLRCQASQNEVTERMVSYIPVTEQNPVINIKTSVWHHIKNNLCKSRTSVKQDFILKANRNGYRADVLKTSHCNSSANNYISSEIMTSVQVKDLNKYKGNPHIDDVAVKEMEPSDCNINGATPSEYLHLSQKENIWKKDLFSSTSSRKTVHLDERIKEPHPSFCRQTGIGMEWFPELYPGYHSIGLRMLPEQIKQLETPIRLSAIWCENTKGHSKYCSKYMNPWRRGAGGAITLLLGCAIFSYIWNYDFISEYISVF
ncbi:uncharacterized protein si:dkey-21c1.4 isoform X2 [Rhincodon typus]|uniref:uncharacterized protein si:dkey-21c1.4 isoform X2 n=1 Tax=Rhincodon typus TaxID=259920 RepID=UPI00202F6D78|nr:uncharacterized protein si:dkey-21c1.4 isoform X2 [Rhincodon typus]